VIPLVVHQAASLREDKARLAAEAGQVPDLRNDRARLAAEVDALRHTLAEHRLQAAASSAELTVQLTVAVVINGECCNIDVWQGSRRAKDSV
jgi:hypothetical protein